MDIAEAIRQDGGSGIRRVAWPADWCIKPFDSELGCVFFSKKESGPRWAPTKKDLIANDWEPVTEF